ncbi:MAG: hypothetical protein FWD31_09165, partial [Planctomycetaceae bacterium]|nr:hypothetical protein [Planctomycetaceae bacterium]
GTRDVNELKKMKPEAGRSGPPPRRTKEKKIDMQHDNNRKHPTTQPLAPLGCASSKTRFLAKISCRYYLIKD